MKPNINLVKVNPQMSNNKHLMDDALMGSDHCGSQNEHSSNKN
jgi:hypothetical protein